MNKLVWAGFIVIAVLAGPALAQKATFREKSGDWSVYAYDAGGKKTCFAAAQPRSTKPKGVKRDPIYFYVSIWPKDNVTGEISIKMGYPLKPGVPVDLKVGAKSFKLFTKASGAYIEKADVEKQAVAAMRGGATMVVKGTSARGTLTTDEYSLSGISKALGAAAAACK